MDTENGVLLGRKLQNSLCSSREDDSYCAGRVFHTKRVQETGSYPQSCAIIFTLPRLYRLKAGSQKHIGRWVNRNPAKQGLSVKLTSHTCAGYTSVASPPRSESALFILVLALASRLQQSIGWRRTPRSRIRASAAKVPQGARQLLV
jgi:hypothetical protein